MITVVVGGTSGLGLEVVRHRSDLGDEVILTGRDPGKAADVASSLATPAPSRWSSPIHPASQPL